MVTVKNDILEEVKNAVGLIKQAKKNGVDIKDVKFGWLKKDKKASLFVTNPLYKESEEVQDIDFKSLFGRIDPIVIKKAPKSEKNAIVDKLFISDVHIGMHIDPKTSMYDMQWNENELFSRLEKIIEFAVSRQQSKNLYIVDLGDYLDGYGGQTTRKGHNLPQNMTDNESFENGLKFKIQLIKSLLPYYENITLRNIVNDNHSGSFAEILSTSLEYYFSEACKNVKVITQRKFMDLYSIGKRTFLTTHGKDSNQLKFGLKAKIDANQTNKILSFLASNGCLDSNNEIYVCKGDSHVYLFDSASSDKFSYWNFPALSPSSSWVQHNFGKGRSGFIVVNFFDNHKTINEYFF
jgi:hypothetical protein